MPPRSGHEYLRAIDCRPIATTLLPAAVAISGIIAFKELPVTSLPRVGRQREQQSEAIAAAQQYLDIAQTRYRTGLESYLDVYTAQTSLLTDQQAAVTLRVQQMTGRVQLIEALGGGWTTALLPSEKTVAAKHP